STGGCSCAGPRPPTTRGAGSSSASAGVTSESAEGARAAPRRRAGPDGSVALQRRPGVPVGYLGGPAEEGRPPGLRAAIPSQAARSGPAAARSAATSGLPLRRRAPTRRPPRCGPAAARPVCGRRLDLKGLQRLPGDPPGGANALLTPTCHPWHVGPWRDLGDGALGPRRCGYHLRTRLTATTTRLGRAGVPALPGRLAP